MERNQRMTVKVPLTPREFGEPALKRMKTLGAKMF